MAKKMKVSDFEQMEIEGYVPNPMWDSIEEKGVYQTSFRYDALSIDWAKAELTEEKAIETCKECESKIFGRRFVIILDGEHTYHMGCISPELWNRALKAPRGGVSRAELRNSFGFSPAVAILSERVPDVPPTAKWIKAVEKAVKVENFQTEFTFLMNKHLSKIIPKVSA